MLAAVHQLRQLETESQRPQISRINNMTHSVVGGNQMRQSVTGHQARPNGVTLVGIHAGVVNEMRPAAAGNATQQQQQQHARGVRYTVQPLQRSRTQQSVAEQRRAQHIEIDPIPWDQFV